MMNTTLMHAGLGRSAIMCLVVHALLRAWSRGDRGGTLRHREGGAAQAIRRARVAFARSAAGEISRSPPSSDPPDTCSAAADSSAIFCVLRLSSHDHSHAVLGTFD